MKVYVVERGEYSDREVVAVRTEKKRANILAKYYKGYVEEFDTEDLAEFEDKKLLYCVQFDRLRVREIRQEDPNWCNEDYSFEGTIFVRAKTEQEAIKLATERQKELLALYE